MQKKSMGPGFAVLLTLAACSSPSGTLDSAPNDAGADLASGDAAGKPTAHRERRPTPSHCAARKRRLLSRVRLLMPGGSP